MRPTNIRLRNVEYVSKVEEPAPEWVDVPSEYRIDFQYMPQQLANLRASYTAQYVQNVSFSVNPWYGESGS